MKKTKFQKIPARIHAALGYALVGLAFSASAIGLLLLVADLAQDAEKKMHILFASVFLFASTGASFFIGCDWSRRLLKGRMMRFQELTCPGTVLPQSQSFFRFHGAHELGNGWAVATFQKITKVQRLTGVSGWVSMRDIFCVLSKKECLPQKPCLVKLDFDQQENMLATIISEQVSERN